MFGNDYKCFQESTVFQNACCMCILQIGELCKIVSQEMRDSISDIPWKSWCGIRDVFAHQYSNLDIESAWQTIQEDLPELKGNIIEILGKNGEV
jgi:uncharacterized protein with HEPN domain